MRMVFVAFKLGLILVVAALLATSACAPAVPSPTATPAPKPKAEEKAVATPASKAKADEKAVPTAAPPKEAKAVEKPAAPTPVAPPASKQAKMKVGNMGLTGEGGVYVALEKGYFREENLDVELVSFGTGIEQVAALAVGELDVGYLSPDAGLFNAILRGVGLKVVMSSAMGAKGGEKAAAVVLRKDLSDAQTVKGPADMRGKTIAVTTLASASAIAVDTALGKGGLSLKDAKMVTMSFPDTMTAFANKAIDAAWEAEPFLTNGKERGLFVPWIYLGDLRPLHDSVVYAYSEKFVSGNADAARRLMLAVLKGNRDYNEAFFGSGKGKAEVVAALMKHTQIKDPAMYEKMGMTRMRPNGEVNLKSLSNDIDWYVANGHMKDKANVETFVDAQYVEYALSKLGSIQE